MWTAPHIYWAQSEGCGVRLTLWVKKILEICRIVANLIFKTRRVFPFCDVEPFPYMLWAVLQYCNLPASSKRDPQYLLEVKDAVTERSPPPKCFNKSGKTFERELKCDISKQKPFKWCLNVLWLRPQGAVQCLPLSQPSYQNWQLTLNCIETWKVNTG